MKFGREVSEKKGGREICGKLQVGKNVDSTRRAGGTRGATRGGGSGGRSVGSQEEGGGSGPCGRSTVQHRLIADRHIVGGENKEARVYKTSATVLLKTVVCRCASTGKSRQ